MSIPDFGRAEYLEPQVIEGEVVGRPQRRAGAFPLALVYGIVAALVGSFGYALIGLSGFMVSIVAIAAGWLIAKAMMTATGGVGGRPYQIASVILTYFAVSLGGVLDIVWYIHKNRPELLHQPVWLAESLLPRLLAGPFMRLGSSPFNGLIGILILFFGLRTAWQMAGGSAGFGRNAGPGRSFIPR